METFFFMLVGMLLAGAGTALAIVARDQQAATRELRCSADE